jgi:hypothetical protein
MVSGRSPGHSAALQSTLRTGVFTPTDKPVTSRRRLDAIGTALAHAFFALLIVVDVIRTLRHAMWRDELDVFVAALSNSSLWNLVPKLRYEHHPALWYALVWLVTRVTTEPMAMQILHIGLAIGVWVIIYVWSPFSRLEKLLLLLSYFLFWEYFVISRDYVLIALTAFAFIVLREQRPRPEFILWLLLGLMANAHVFGAIWSMVLAAMLAMDGVRRRSMPAAETVGAAAYLILLVFAIATVAEPPEFHLANDAQFHVSQLNADVSTPIGAFVPFAIESIRDAIAFVVHPGAAAIPRFWNSTPTADFIALTHADTDHPARLALLFAVPIVLCWFVTRNALLVLEFALVYLGILLFENIAHYPGGARHHGVVFLAFIAATWSARARQPSTIWSRWLLAAILLVNACGGVLTLASELRPFSEGYDTAAWIKQNNLANAFLVGSHDAQVLTVAGYLGLPVYYLECECFDMYGPRNRLDPLPAEEFGRRLGQAAALAGARDAILIRNRPVIADELKLSAPNLSVTLLKSFTNAVTDENFWIYRLSAQP